MTRPLPALDVAAVFTAILVALAVYVVLVWLAVAFWMARDARRRGASASLTAAVALLGLLMPLLGALLYLMVRPPHAADEAAAEGEEPDDGLGGDIETGSRPCPTCGRAIEADFVVCPYCRTQFARRCRACQRWLRLGWRICPYCAEEVGVQSVERSGRALG